MSSHKKGRHCPPKHFCPAGQPPHVSDTHLPSEQYWSPVHVTPAHVSVTHWRAAQIWPAGHANKELFAQSKHCPAEQVCPLRHVIL
jgi:hypothetical protein